MDLKEALLQPEPSTVEQPPDHLRLSDSGSEAAVRFQATLGANFPLPFRRVSVASGLTFGGKWQDDESIEDLLRPSTESLASILAELQRREAYAFYTPQFALNSLAIRR